MTRPTNYEKRGSSVRPEECLFYICVFLSPLYKYYSSWLQSPLFFPLFYFILFIFYPHIWILIFLLYLNTNHPNPTLGGLKLHSQDFCLIRNILVSFYSTILVVPPLFMVISSLMRLGEWLSCI